MPKDDSSPSLVSALPRVQLPFCAPLVGPAEPGGIPPHGGVARFTVCEVALGEREKGRHAEGVRNVLRAIAVHRPDVVGLLLPLDATESKFDQNSYTLAYFLNSLAACLPLTAEASHRITYWATGHVREDGTLRHVDDDAFLAKLRAFCGLPFHPHAVEDGHVFFVPAANWAAITGGRNRDVASEVIVTICGQSSFEELSELLRSSAKLHAKLVVVIPEAREGLTTLCRVLFADRSEQHPEDLARKAWLRIIRQHIAAAPALGLSFGLLLAVVIGWRLEISSIHWFWLVSAFAVLAVPLVFLAVVACPIDTLNNSYAWMRDAVPRMSWEHVVVFSASLLCVVVPKGAWAAGLLGAWMITRLPSKQGRIPDLLPSPFPSNFAVAEKHTVALRCAAWLAFAAFFAGTDLFLPRSPGHVDPLVLLPAVMGVVGMSNESAFKGVMLVVRALRNRRVVVSGTVFCLWAPVAVVGVWFVVRTCFPHATLPPSVEDAARFWSRPTMRLLVDDIAYSLVATIGAVAVAVVLLWRWRDLPRTFDTFRRAKALSERRGLDLGETTPADAGRARLAGLVLFGPAWENRSSRHPRRQGKQGRST